MIPAVLVRTEPHVGQAVTFWLEPERRLRFTAGQFTELHLPHEPADDRGTKRWFTISSSPDDPLIGITTRLTSQPSSFKRHLQQLQPGDKVLLAEPMGDFVLPLDRQWPLLLVGIGLGITPIHSMLTWLNNRNEPRDIHIIYADQAGAFLWHDTFAGSGYKVEFCTGIPRADNLFAATEKSTRLLYLAGPEPIIEQLSGELFALGMAESQLIRDHFPGYVS